MHATLDQLREAYVDLYAEAEAISRSSVVAAEQRHAGVPGGTGRPGCRAASAPRGAADRVPHGLRAMVPPKVRRGLRQMAGRERA